MVLSNLKYKLFITIRILKIISILGVENTHHLWLPSEPIVINYMHFLFWMISLKTNTATAVQWKHHIIILEWKIYITQIRVFDEIMEYQYSVKLENILYGYENNGTVTNTQLHTLLSEYIEKTKRFLFQCYLYIKYFLLCYHFLQK